MSGAAGDGDAVSTNQVAVTSTGSPDLEQPPAVVTNVADMRPAFRAELIQKAVEFLLSQPVLSSARPLQEKMDFLVRKGLTADEVAEAVRRANLSSVGGPVTGAIAVGSTLAANLSPPPLPQRQASAPLQTRVARLAFTAAAVGAVAYGAYHLYSAYLKPYVHSKLGRRAKESARGEVESVLPAAVEQLLGRLSDSVAELSRNVGEQQLLLQQLIARVDGQKAVTYREDRPATSPTSSIEELKSEVQSVKRLLLSKHQFPPAPVSAPVLPAWQMDDTRGGTANVANPTATALAGNSTSTEVNCTSVSGRTISSGAMPSVTTAGLLPSSTAFPMSTSSAGDSSGASDAAAPDRSEQSRSVNSGADASAVVA